MRQHGRAYLRARMFFFWQEESFHDGSTAAINSAVRRVFGKADLVLITANSNELWAVWAFLGCNAPAQVRHRVIERTEAPAPFRLARYYLNNMKQC
jgi:hypothetical protein